LDALIEHLQEYRNWMPTRRVDEREIKKRFVNYLFVNIHYRSSLRGVLLYIFHVYLEEWHSDVSRHWPFNQAVRVQPARAEKG
jgi:hypothetical protein